MRALVLFGLAAGLLSACADEDPPAGTPPTGKADGAAGFSGSSSTKDGGGGDASAADASDATYLPEASNVVVRVGIAPVPAGAADGGSNHVEETLAHQYVVAAGSRAVTVARRWDALFAGSGQPIEEEWQYLSGVSKLHSGSDRVLLLSLAVVDRTLDARPASLAGAWDSAPVTAAMHALIDRTLSSFGEELGYLSLGTEVDRFLAPMAQSERTAFVAFAKDSLDYARAHPLAPESLKLGVSLSSSSALEGAAPPAYLAELANAGDLAFIVHHALDASFQPRPPSSAPGDLDALWKAAGRPIVLEQVAYPSEGSLDKQRAFYDSLFVALLSRRERFPFVAVMGSNERSLADCEADALALDAPGDPSAIAAYCSFGLRGPDGANKPAWASVVDGLVTFSSP
jgi:hypothetical protein